MSDVSIPEDALRHEATLPVLGIPVRLRSDSPEVTAAFEEAFGCFRALDEHPQLVAADRVEGRVMLHEGREGDDRPTQVRYRLPDPKRLICWTPGSVCCSDAERREFAGWVTSELIADRAHFRTAVLESLVLSVVTWMDRVPVHGSALVRDGAALLLTGPSGTGKSTLTYAAACAGMQVLTDEIVFAQRTPARAWGLPRVVNLPADAGRFFPELRAAARRVLPNGKEKIPVELAALRAAPALPVVEHLGVCLLERADGAGGIRVERVEPDEVVRAMIEDLEVGFHLFEAQLPAIVRGWARAGGWRLTVGGDPAAAVPAVEAMLAELSGSAAAAAARTAGP